MKEVKVLVIQSYPTLCDPVDPTGFSIHGILQARILEWVAIPFSRGSSWPRDQTQVFCIAEIFFEPPGKTKMYATALNQREDSTPLLLTFMVKL